MYTNYVIYPYNLGSASARVLAQALGGKRVRENGRYRYRQRHKVINWGNPRLPSWGTPKAMAAIWNKPQNVQLAASKIATFERLNADDVPLWTTIIDVARGWFAQPLGRNCVNAVLCRTLTRANSGHGIVFASNPDELVPAPLYVRYIPKREEYRVHVARGRVIDKAQKRRRNGTEHEGITSYIRSFDHGWVFCREDVQLPEAVEQKALTAVAHLGLDFGAVDIGQHERYGTKVYEVNTAPGLMGTTIQSYVGAFTSA